MFYFPPTPPALVAQMPVDTCQYCNMFYVGRDLHFQDGLTGQVWHSVGTHNQVLLVVQEKGRPPVTVRAYRK
jgi:hypothetical protein